MNEPQFAAWVAIDWADHKHYWLMQAAANGARQQGCLEHTPEAIDVWAGDLERRFARQPVAVCLEQSRGPVGLSTRQVFPPGAVSGAPGHREPVSRRLISLRR